MRASALIAAELVVRQEELRRRQQRASLVAAHQAVARFGVLPEAVDRGIDIAMQRDDRIGGKVIDQRRGRIEEERQVVLDAAGHDTGGNVLVQRRTRRIALECLAEPAAKTRAPGVVEGNSRAGRRRTSRIG